MKKSELRTLVREEIAAIGNEPKKSIDKVSDAIVSIRYIQQQIFKTKPKQAELLGKAVEYLEKAQNSL